MPRIPRAVAPDYPHHITQRGTNKSDIFIDDEDRRCFLFYLEDSLGKSDTELWAYCLMNNHFHLLAVPRAVEGLGQFIHNLTFRYAQYFNHKYARTGRLWQNRYFSCIVDKDAYLWAAASYIEKNPVRAKMVQRAEEWEWSSAKAHIKGVESPLLTVWLEPTDRDGYKKYVKEDADDEPIRKATSTGRPLASLKIIKKLEAKLERQLTSKGVGRPWKK